jgi:hypothetical protein
LIGTEAPAIEAARLPNRNNSAGDPLDRSPARVAELPAEVAQARLDAAADDAANEEVARPRIEAVLTACKLTAKELESMHRTYADITDLDLTGYSRASAIWLLSGRTLGLLRALLVQIGAGICTEAMVTGRAIHEASRVLFAFGAPEADDVARLWLDDEGRHGYVKQGTARAAEERYETALGEAMERDGLPRIPPTMEKTQTLYDLMSRGAHNRRSSCVEAVSVPSRQMAYGRHPSPILRAAAADWAALMTSEVLNSVGDALRALYSQPQFLTGRIVPLQQGIDAVRQSAPLDEQSIRLAAGTA